MTSFSYLARLEAGVEFSHTHGLSIVSGGLKGPSEDTWCCPLGAAAMAARGSVEADLMFPSEFEASKVMGGRIDDWLEILRAIDAAVDAPVAAALHTAKDIDERRELRQVA